MQSIDSDAVVQSRPCHSLGGGRFHFDRHCQILQGASLRGRPMTFQNQWLTSICFFGVWGLQRDSWMSPIASIMSEPNIWRSYLLIVWKVQISSKQSPNKPQTRSRNQTDRCLWLSIQSQHTQCGGRFLAGWEHKSNKKQPLAGKNNKKDRGKKEEFLKLAPKDIQEFFRQKKEWITLDRNDIDFWNHGTGKLFSQLPARDILKKLKLALS